MAEPKPETLHEQPQVPLPLTFFQEVSRFVQNVPAWLFTMLSLFTIFFSYQIVGGVLLLVTFGFDVTKVDIAAYRWATMLGQIVFILGPTFLLAKLRFPRVENVFRIGRFDIGQILLVLVAVFALQQVLQGYMLLQESSPMQLPAPVQDLIDKMKQMMEEMYRTLTAAHSLPEFLFVVLVIAVTPAICEELMFRGLIQRTLEEEPRQRLSPDVRQSTSQATSNRGLKAAVIAGIIFGLYHLNPFSLIPLVTLGIFFGFIVYRTQNIIPAMVAHFFNNFLACLAAYLHLEDDFLAIAPTEQPTASMIATNFALSVLVFGAATWYFVRNTSQREPLQSDTLSGRIH